MAPKRDSFYRILKDSTRQRIIKQLYSEGPLTYVDLMNRLGISNTGKFNYHLKILAEFLEKNEDGKYCLNENGVHAAQLLANYPNETFFENKINIRSVVFIGFLGFVLTLLNPAIIEGFTGVPLIVEWWLYIPAIAYTFLMPGPIMWWLSVKRMKTHDFRDLAKPPVFAILLLTCMVALFAFLHWYIGLELPLVQKSIGEPQTTGYFEDGVWHTIAVQQTVYTGFIVWMLPFAGFYSLIGVGLVEAVWRILKRKA
jgi:hypothetical protein